MDSEKFSKQEKLVDSSKFISNLFRPVDSKPNPKCPGYMTFKECLNMSIFFHFRRKETKIAEVSWFQEPE